MSLGITDIKISENAYDGLIFHQNLIQQVLTVGQINSSAGDLDFENRLN